MRQIVFLMTLIFFFSGCTKDVDNHLLVSYSKRPTPETTAPAEPTKPLPEEETQKIPFKDDMHYGLPVLPNASGFGLDTEGGKGGQIIKVTNLNKEGPESFKEAIDTPGPRIIVFEVGGVIDLEGARLDVKEPYVTIAGQTAPYPGITLIKGTLRVYQTHDVIVQHITVRTGEAGKSKQSGWNRDAIVVSTSYDVIIDHCTATWSTDENLSVTGPWARGETPEEWQQNTSHRVTISNCIIAHGLNNSTHSKGAHSMGTFTGDGTNEILIYGNLYAHNRWRNPLIKSNCEVAVVNNYIYNYGRIALHTAFVASEWGEVQPLPSVLVIEGNEIEAGPSTDPTGYVVDFYGGGKIYHDVDAQYITWALEEPVWLTKRPFWPAGLTLMPRTKVKSWTLENAGARPWDRDQLTVKLIEDIKAGGGKIIDSEIEAGGYPSYTPTYREFVEEEWDMASMTKMNAMP